MPLRRRLDLMAAIWAILMAADVFVSDSARADPAAGRLKAGACVVCHGPLGIGQRPDTPNLAGQPEIYLIEQLKAYRAGKRRHEVMDVVAKDLSDLDIDDLAAWFSSIVVRAEPR